MGKTAHPVSSAETYNKTKHGILRSPKVAEQYSDTFPQVSKNKWPKDFFQLLVKSDWRRWVAAVKKEIAGWTDNNAVTVIDINEVPATAKIVPLGELYSIKRDGTYKFRQYIMGNLLREGVDFADTFQLPSQAQDYARSIRLPLHARKRCGDGTPYADTFK